MPNTAIKIPNDVGNRVCLFGIQTVPQTAVPPDMRLNGTPDITTTFPLIDEDEVTGTYMDLANPAFDAPQHAGNLAATLSYENMASLLRLGLESGAAPAISAAPAYTYDQEPILTYDDSDTATFQYGVPGDMWQASGVRYNQFNVEGAVGDASYWKLGAQLALLRHDQIAGTLVTATGGSTTTIVLTGAGWTVNQWAGAWVYPDADTNKPGARQVVSNTIDTLTVSPALDVAATAGAKFLLGGLAVAGLPALAEDKIVFAGTKLYIDPATGTLGTTQILQRFIGFNVTVELALDPKTFAEDTAGPSGVYGRGKLRITGQLRLEADRPDEYRQLKALSQLAIRIEKLGPVIPTSAVQKMARIDIPRAIWTERTRDTRNNNLTQTMAFRAVLNTPPIRFVTRNGLATLP